MAAPRKYKTADELQKKIDEYFSICEETAKIPTPPDMVINHLKLGWTTWHDMSVYTGENSKESESVIEEKRQIAEVIKNTRTRMGYYVMQRGFENPKNQIFCLALLKQQEFGQLVVDKPTETKSDIKLNIVVGGVNEPGK